MTYDVVVVGLGPDGITTAIHLMNMGKSVLILESNSSAGGCWSDFEVFNVENLFDQCILFRSNDSYSH
jgi:phytoene dehydrogenase-like protein